MKRNSLRAALSAFASVAVIASLGTLAPTAVAHDGVDHGNEPALDWTNYEKVLLTKDTGEPIDMAVMPDGRVLHSARNGDIRLTSPADGTTKVINKVDVYSNSEDGMQTLTLDPDFETNKWVYLYYAPRTMDGTAQNGAPYPTTTPTGSAPNTLPAGQTEAYWNQWQGYNQLTRVKWDPASNSLDLSTEQVIIKIEVQRGQCCHVAGDVDFDADGNLYLSTGDNTPAGTPGANGYAPNNDAPGMNPGLDARRGPGNTNDLRGKIVRIKVGADGSYTIPAGNLFAPGTAKTRPEIFAMGLRNPFRMDVDSITNSVSWGDYGPDAGAANAQRGPMGYVEWQSTAINKPINGGWPYCHGPNANYNDWDFATATPRAWFDCEAGAISNSRHNTGLAQVPPATAPQLYYGDLPGQQPRDELVNFGAGTGQGPMGGPVYHYDANNPSKTKFPAYWDKKAFFAEFSQDYLAVFDVAWPDGAVTHIQDFLPNSALNAMAQPVNDNPIDIEFGPDGSLYILDYGDGFFRQNPDAGLYRVDYVVGNKSPSAKIKASPLSSSSAPLTVNFDGSASTDPEKGALTYEWDFNGDGTWDATGAKVSHTYTTVGNYTARLRVTDPEGSRNIQSVQISVGNVAPTVNVETPPDGAFFNWGDAVPFKVSTTDPEDGNETDCTKVTWTFGLGHGIADDVHAHPLSQGTGCQFAIPTPADAPEHGETENIYGVVVIRYTDKGAPGVGAATTEVPMILNPTRQEAEWADAREGVTVEQDPAAGGRAKVTSFDAGDWLAWDPVNFRGITAVDVRGSGNGTIQFRWNSPTAAPFATAAFSSSAMSTTRASLANAPSGTGVLYVTSTGGVVLDTLNFVGDGVKDTEAPVVSVTLNPAAPNGANGWYTSNVSVTVNATDNGTVAARERSVDGGATWQNANNALTVSAEGVTTVLFRARDNGGNVSQVGSVTIKIDKTAPVVSVQGVTDGGSVSNTGSITVNATDAVSGIDKVTATIDGVAVAADQPIALWKLTPGAHTLVVTATDKAGHTTTQTVGFTVTTSLSDLTQVVKQLGNDGVITKAGERKLLKRLDQAKKHADAGRTQAAVSQIEGFIEEVKDPANVPDAAARAALIAAAQEVINQLRG